MVRTRWLLWVAVLLVLLGGCGGDGEWFNADGSELKNPVSGHLDELEQLEVFAGDPPFASSTGGGRRDRCHEPDFERREPATWRDFSFEGPPGTVLSYYTEELLNDGWEQAGATDNPDFPSVRFEKSFGDWTGSMRLTIIVSDSAYDLTAEDSTSQVCPS